jgi:hypothetical protein
VEKGHAAASGVRHYFRLSEQKKALGSHRCRADKQSVAYATPRTCRRARPFSHATIDSARDDAGLSREETRAIPTLETAATAGVVALFPDASRLADGRFTAVRS